ncbi:MAG: penicillin-binding protein 2 [Nitrococcus mobilis]|nr:penicillin-binding protein 2 [Nitrococcus mobilis]
MIRHASDSKPRPLPKWRPVALLCCFVGFAGGLIWRAVDLQVLDRDFLLNQGAARFLRDVEIPAHRGVIRDRNGEPLAISTPVDSVWADPGDLLLASHAKTARLAQLLQLDAERLRADLHARRAREFVYLRRRITPNLGQQVVALRLPGVALQREYRRFYPAGEVAGQLVGFTNIDDVGQEGMELAFNDWLRGKPGAKRVIKDRLGRVIEDVERLREPKPGHDLVLSVDRRLQYIAYRALKAAVRKHDAQSGSLVLLDARTGEVLVMVNQPAFNPNDRAELIPSHYRNRAVTDAFEPGSSLKPFTIAAALDSGRFAPHSLVDTTPGVLRVASDTVHDVRNYGVIDVMTVIEKSSNVGAAKIALDLKPGTVWRMLGRVGFGRPTGSGFPGETDGYLSGRPPRYPIDRATLAFGYGVSATALQLAQAYTAIANDGRLLPVSLLRVNSAPAGQRVMSARSARAVRSMMEQVVSSEGTAPKAAIPGYRIAGKTGTVKKSASGGYSERRYVALFAGIAPASAPRFVCAVIINEPTGKSYYGGLVAAPIFRHVVEGALRLRNVPPDGRLQQPALLAAGEMAP